MDKTMGAARRQRTEHDLGAVEHLVVGRAEGLGGSPSDLGVEIEGALGINDHVLPRDALAALVVRRERVGVLAWPAAGMACYHSVQSSYGRQDEERKKERKQAV